MRFTEVTDEGIIRSVANGYKRTKIFCLLDEFQESGMSSRSGHLGLQVRNIMHS